MLLKKIFLFFFSFLFYFSSIAQNEASKDSSYQVMESVIVEGDTLAIYRLNTIQVYSPRTFKNKREERKYDKLQAYVVKVYPYAKVAGEMLRDFEDTLNGIQSEKKKKAYIKTVERQLMAEFEGELKKLTIKQGIILIKLIDRETGTTSYDLVKDLRGSFTAFFWQSLARLFGSNLKLEYDAVGEDEMIEEIVTKIEQGQIPYKKRERKNK